MTSSVLRAPVGDWPTGTVGAVISAYGDTMLVEISDADGRTSDTLQVPADQLEPKLHRVAEAAPARPVVPGLEEVLEQAIRERRVVALEYRYRGQGRRTVHPHVLYRTAAGRVYVDTYQVDGYTSAARTVPGWRAFDVEQVISAELLDGRFAPADGYNLDAPKYRGGILASAA